MPQVPEVQRDDLAELRYLPPAGRDFRELPKLVRDRFDLALRLVRGGFEPDEAKSLKGFHGRQVLELKANGPGGTYRTVYTVRFEGVVYVLHAWQKKSKTGTKTDKKDIELIKARLAWADLDYKNHPPNWKKEER